MHYGKNLLPATVGFDRLFSTLDELDSILGNTKPSNFPHYNIVKFDDYNYEIQIAVAGFSKDELQIEVNQNKLSINGAMKSKDDGVVYLHRGLASRDFKQVYTLFDTSVVRSADIVDGILKIKIENVVPEERKPRMIPIGTDVPQLTAK